MQDKGRYWILCEYVWAFSFISLRIPNQNEGIPRNLGEPKRTSKNKVFKLNARQYGRHVPSRDLDGSAFSIYNDFARVDLFDAKNPRCCCTVEARKGLIRALSVQASAPERIKLGAKQGEFLLGERLDAFSLFVCVADELVVFLASAFLAGPVGVAVEGAEEEDALGVDLEARDALELPTIIQKDSGEEEGPHMLEQGMNDLGQSGVD